MSDGRGKIAKQYTVHIAKLFWCQQLRENTNAELLFINKYIQTINIYSQDMSFKFKNEIFFSSCSLDTKESH